VAKLYLVYRVLLAATDCVFSCLAGDWGFLSVILSHIFRFMLLKF
jgi:hypothetical protein